MISKTNTAALLVFVFMSSFLPLHVLAYGVSTHAYLTEEIIEFYNERFPEKKISEEFTDYLIDGARKEDDLPRWMNHFYDPVQNRGLTHDPAIDPLVPVGDGWLASKDWSRDEGGQNDKRYKVPTAIASILTALQERKISALTTETNFTWQRAIRHYVRGEKEKAFFMLGHVVHLIEDASVPDHTRNDPHPPTDDGGSPYENWTDQFHPGNHDPELKERLRGKSAAAKGNLDEHFDELAGYSNRNFYSEDTIGIQSGYSFPEIDTFELIKESYYALGLGPDGESYKLFLKKVVAGSLITPAKNELTLKDKEVMRDYWSLLAPKAIQHGAGVIDLFFREAEKAKNDPHFVSAEPKSFVGVVIETVQNAARFIADKISGEGGEDISMQDGEETEESVGKDIPAPESSEEESLESDSLVQNDTIPPDTLQEPFKKEESELPRMQGASSSFPVVQSQRGGSSFSGGGGGAIVTITGVQSENSTSETSTEETVPIPEIDDIADEVLVEDAGDLPAVPESTGADHIVISEVLFDAEGSDAGKEFVELYNPTESAMSLHDWVLKHEREGVPATSLAIVGSKDEDALEIPAKGFLLIGFNGYSSATFSKDADVVRSASLPNGGSAEASESVRVMLFDKNGEEIDAMSYDMGLISEAGQSVERKAWNGGCVAAHGEGEFLGNGCDTDDASDLAVRENPTPQNSESFPEPRMAPQARDFEAQYNWDTLTVSFSWGESSDFSGATSTVSYALLESQTGSPIFEPDARREYAMRIYEVGRAYDFTLRAMDRDGLGSEAQARVEVSDLVDALYFAPDPRPGRESGHVVDIRYPQYPFIPKVYGDGRNLWQAVVFYVNRAPNVDNSILRGTAAQVPEDLEGVLPVLDHGAPGAVFGLTPENCGGTGEGIRVNCFYLSDEELRLVAPVGLPSGMAGFTEDDFVTVAYYDFQVGIRDPLRLAAYSNAKHYFSDMPPPEERPSSPGNATASINPFSSVLNINWEHSTDADSPDASILYQLNIASSSELDEGGWADWRRANEGGSTNFSFRAIFPEEYRIGIRAVDDAGNASEPAILEFRFPEGFIPYITGGQRDEASQDFVLAQGGILDSIQVFTADASMNVPNSNTVLCSLRLYDMSSGETLIATNDTPNSGDGASGNYAYRGYGCAGELNFTYHGVAIELEAGKRYRWIFSMNSDRGRVRFYGRDANPAGGAFSGGEFRNALFVVKNSAGEPLLDTR